MAKYAITGGYTAETWAKLVQNPEDRTGPVTKLIESIGGKLDTIFWTMGDDDYLVIFDAPDDISAAAGSVAVAGSGALRHVKTTKLLTADQLTQVLQKAKTAAGAYSPPGSRQPAGVR